MLERALVFALFALLFSACVTTDIPDDLAGEIPDGATAIEVTSSQTPSDYYRTLFRELRRNGFTISEDNAEMLSMTTGFREVGQETTLQVSVFVEESPSGSRAVIRGRWGITTTMAAAASAATGGSVSGGSAERAEWDGSGRSKAAFGEMAEIVRGFPHQDLEYQTAK